MALPIHEGGLPKIFRIPDIIAETRSHAKDEGPKRGGGPGPTWPSPAVQLRGVELGIPPSQVVPTPAEEEVSASIRSNKRFVTTIKCAAIVSGAYLFYI